MANKKIALSKSQASTAYRISASDLHKLKVQNCRPLSTERIEELARSIAEHGQLQAGLCRSDAAGNPVLYAGERRLRAIQLINEDPSEWGLKKPLDYEYRLNEVPEGPPTVLAAIEDNINESLSLYDICTAMGQLSRHGWSNDEIVNNFPQSAGRAARFTVNRANVALALWVINSLPQDVQSRIHTGEIKRGAVAGLKNVCQALSLTDSETCILADCIGKSKKDSQTFETWLSKLLSGDCGESRVIDLAQKVAACDLADEPIYPRTLNALAKGKTLSQPDQGFGRTIEELAQLLKVADTPSSRLMMKILTEGEGLEDEQILRMFRTLSEDADDE